MYTYCRADVDVLHILRGDKYVLLSIRRVGRIDHHLHANAAVNGIHKHIELIKAANRTSYGFPHGKKQANGRKRLLAATKRTRVFVTISTLSAILVISLDLQLQCSVVMVEENLAKIPSIRKMVLKHDLATERDVASKIVPFFQAEAKGLLESFVQRRHALQISLCRLERSSRPVNLGCHLLY